MATITTDTFLDDGTARTAGETWALNGAKLTIRTDTRWHAGSPASMTGTLGTVTVSSTLGGNFYVDGTQVRWLAYDTGTGNVPAIGTTITQGGVSGYLLGVWSSYTSAPTAVGAAMPATGWIKFRSVTGGAFAAGALTGIGANATGADVVGWIEVVMDHAASVVLSPLGTSMEMYGAWFELGTTSGSPHQLVDVPANGGGVTTRTMGVQIETAPSSGVYEWYPAVDVSVWTAGRMNTDARAKMVLATNSGSIRIGGDGAVLIGFTPAAGCKIRVPNIFLRQCTTAARATNSINSSITSRPSISSTQSFSTAIVEKVCADWNFAPATAGTWTVRDSAFDARLQFTNVGVGLTIERCSVGYASNLNSNGFNIVRCANLTMSDSVCAMPNNTMLFTSVQGTVTNYKSLNISAKSSGTIGISLSTCSNLTFTNTRTINGNITSSYGSNIKFYNTDYIDRTAGDTTNGASASVFVLTTERDFLIDGITFGFGGTLSNTHPYGQLLSTTTGCVNTKMRNVGTYASPLNCGANSSLFPAYVHSSTGEELNTKIQRVYLSGTRTGIAQVGDFTSRGLLYEHVYGTLAGTGQVGGLDAIWRSIGHTSTQASYLANSRGISFISLFTSTTQGRVVAFGAAPTTASPYSTLYSPLGTSRYGSSSITMPTVGDYYETESSYWIKGYTSFQNVAPTINGGQTGNFTYTYQIDTGSGWSSSKTLNAANLSAESISAVTGFKLRIRATVATANASNVFTSATVFMNTTSSAQGDNLYDLDTSTLSFTGLVAGSEVRCYTGSDPATAVEIGGTESSGTSFSFTHSSGGVVGYIRIFALGYQPISFDPYTYSSSDTTLLIQQVVDRNYVNP